MILFLDTSALIKRYVAENHSDEVVAVIETFDLVGTSVLTRVEMAAALTKATRQAWVQQEIARRSWQDFLRHWPAFTRINVTTTSIDRATALAWEYGLRGYAAMHLAAALTWQDTLDSPVTLATFDRDLWLAAEKERLTVWPEQL